MALGALALGACNYGLGISPEPADPGDTVTVTNSPVGPFCVVPDGDESIPVDVVVISGTEDGPEDLQIVSVDSDEEGYFTAEVTAPDRPGEHLVIAQCGGVDGGLEPLAAQFPVDEDGAIVDTLRVTQDPLTIALSKTTAKIGDEVTATFNRCQAENDFGFGEEGGVPAHEDGDVTPEELGTDYPDLVVYLDDEPVATIEGDERYPTGTVDVPVELTSAGTHEIKGICTYQTFDADWESIIEEFNEGIPEFPDELGGVGTAHLDYPIVMFDYFTFDEATTEAAATVTVGAAAAAPAVVAPDFTG